MSSTIIIIYGIGLICLFLIIVLGKLETKDGEVVDMCISEIHDHKYKDVDIKSKLNKRFTFFRWKKLTMSLINNGYQPEKYGYVTITNKGTVINGDHRMACLKYVYNSEFTINVKVVKHNYWYRYTIKLLYLPLFCFLPAILLYPVLIFISRYD